MHKKITVVPLRNGQPVTKRVTVIPALAPVTKRVTVVRDPARTGIINSARGL